MILEINRTAIVLIPENDLEIAYLEDTLCLKKDGDYVRLVKHDDFENGAFLVTEVI